MAIDIEAPGADAEELKTALRALLAPSGGAFPGTPTVGQRFIRTDFDSIEFEWNGTQWLSTQIFMRGASSFVAAAATITYYIALPYMGTCGHYIERVDYAAYRNVAGEWDASVGWVNSANAETTLASFDGLADANATFVTKNAAVNAVLDALAKALFFRINEISGTSALYGDVNVAFRLVAT